MSRKERDTDRNSGPGCLFEGANLSCSAGLNSEKDCPLQGPSDIC